MNSIQIPVKKASLVNNSSYQNVAQKYEQAQGRIEAMASFIKRAEGVLSQNELQDLHNQLSAEILAIKNLKAFVPSAAPLGELLEHQYKSEEYCGKAFAASYAFAWRHYGEIDQQTGKPAAFLKLFNIMYKKKAGDIIAENVLNQNPGENRYKATKLRELFREALLETNYQHEVPRFNVLSKTAMQQQLKTIGASKRYFDKLDEITDETHVISHDLYAENGEIDRDSSDTTVYLEDTYADLAVENLLSRIEQLQEKCKSLPDKAVGKNLIFYVTLKAREYLKTGNRKRVMLLSDYIDKDLLRYAYEHESANDSEIFAEYMGQEYNTARKKLRKVELAFQEMAG